MRQSERNVRQGSVTNLVYEHGVGEWTGKEAGGVTVHSALQIPS